ncbi:hypothetical protein OHA77_31740 [Streptosporangium sp. NBC_01639]|uniref:hypothetical protein n=1 Tax=unclassified Streptosporangium TaxID=2632669 RepID=UPI002DDA7242|nr:hypothetical protein [Streptosporangium sp. NBC_01756]WSC88139.1 hypothetical protein OIE48_08070 [Streptosporangium sp. NBC_01756]WTD53184.1 hypothetical protein OHA77_31740 [Streptosporangium sp. NBC_01639]
MEIVITFLLVALMLFSFDRLMLWLESRGHVSWRRTRRRTLSAEPTAGLDTLLGGPLRDRERRS